MIRRVPAIRRNALSASNVKAGDLRRPVATVARGEIRQPVRDLVARNMTPARLGNVLKAVTNGDPAKFLTFADEMEERDLHYRSVLQTRKLAVLALDWQVQPASESPKDADVAKFVREVLASDSFSDARLDWLDGVGKGWGICEMHWQTDGPRWYPERFAFVEPWHFRLDPKHQREIRLVSGTEAGEELPPFKFAVHTPRMKSGNQIRAGMAYACGAWSLLKAYAVKDWAQFLEVFGMPPRIGRYPDNATEEEKASLKRAIRDLGAGAWGTLPSSMTLEFPKVQSVSSASGGGPHSGFHDTANAEISKVVLGQTMTVEDGSSLAQAKVHDEVRTDIRNADAKSLASMITAKVIRPIVLLNYGEGVALPKFVIDTSEEEDQAAVVQNAEKFAALGGRVSEAHLAQRLGFPAPQAGERLLAPGLSPGDDGPVAS